jgi:isoquinoline 1-oxidoreductase beta subunit
MSGVIRLATEKAGWGRTFPKGRGLGLGFHFCHLGYVAEVAEVSVSPSGDLAVPRVVAAVDVGSQIVNLSGAENQVQGAIVDGLSAAWRQELNIKDGRLVQANFNDYPLLRIGDAPRSIEVHFLKTGHPPTGLGEPGLPPLAPAVANAVFAAVGIRIRRLPFANTDLRWS